MSNDNDPEPRHSFYLISIESGFFCGLIKESVLKSITSKETNEYLDSNLAFQHFTVI